MSVFGKFALVLSELSRTKNKSNIQTFLTPLCNTSRNITKTLRNRKNKRGESLFNRFTGKNDSSTRTLRVFHNIL